MTLKSISLNDEVEVVLTDFGKQILDNYRTKVEQEIKLSMKSSMKSKMKHTITVYFKK